MDEATRGANGEENDGDDAENGDGHDGEGNGDDDDEDEDDDREDDADDDIKKVKAYINANYINGLISNHSMKSIIAC